MWKLIEISQQIYFAYCDVNITKEEVTFILYDLKESWTQTVAFKDVKLKVKRLNKRFDYSEDNIKEALTNGNVKSAAIEEQPHSSVIEQECLLVKLQYGIHSYVLNYEWNLRKQTLMEFQENFVQPLLMGLLGCYQQVEILAECIRKKDAELNQYRIEQGILNRRTLATKPFDFNNFNQQYENSKQIAINFKELATYVQKIKTQSATDTLGNNNIKPKPIKDEEKSNSIQKKSKSITTTPTRRKRRKEFELLCLERQLKARKEGGLRYESSQSQSVSSDNSQIQDEIKAEVLKGKPPHKEDCKNKSIADKQVKLSQKNKSASPIKEKPEVETLYETDTDSDITLKSHKNTVNSLKTKKEDTILRKLSGRKLSYSPKSCSKTIITNNKSNDIVGKDSSICSETLNGFEFVEGNMDTRECPKSLRESQTKTPLVIASPSRGTNLSRSPLPPVYDDLSSQLSNIKKELECLEAMRLADLKKRTCKA